jgi:heparin/heparan-sulfate lyase
MLPPARLFPENGHAVMRSDWTPEATYALFRCGRFGEIDGAWGRNNADNLQFVITKAGILAADTGAVHSLNNAALGFAGSQVHSDGLPHIREYARQTIAHNSITVGSAPLELRGWKDALLGTVRSGGQSPIQDKSWWKAWGLPEPKPGDRPFKEGAIVAYETSPLFDYAAGDATHSYPPTRVKSITRQFVYLRPDTFVIFDRVASAEAGWETNWLLHALYEPAFDGQKVPDLSLAPDRQLVVTPDGASTAPNPKPGGRFLHSGGSTFTIDDRWPGMTGRLFVKILRPETDRRVLRTVGGPWHEFEVEGINYGPTEDTYAKHQKQRKAHDRENSIGLEGWRIELSPKDRPNSTDFLVVLQTSDQTTRKMATVERIERPEEIGAKVMAGTRVYEVTFATQGPLGGHMRISESGKVVVDRELAAAIEDNYRKWLEDPRYKNWTNRPEYMKFIGPETDRVGESR